MTLMSWPSASTTSYFTTLSQTKPFRGENNEIPPKFKDQSCSVFSSAKSRRLKTLSPRVFTEFATPAKNRALKGKTGIHAHKRVVERPSLTS